MSPDLDFIGESLFHPNDISREPYSNKNRDISLTKLSQSATILYRPKENEEL